MGVSGKVNRAGFPALECCSDDEGSYHGERMGDKDARVVRRGGTADEATAVPVLTASATSSAETLFSLTPRT
jgi:hypothetical protein